MSNKLTRLLIKSPDSIIKYFFWYKKLNKTLKEISPDLVHTFLYFMPYSYQAYLYCKKNKIPLITYEELQREPTFIITKLLNRFLLFFMRRTMIKYTSFVTTATKMGVDFQKIVFAEKNKIIHIPWPVDEHKYLLFNRPKKIGKAIRLLVVARFVPFKKYDTIIDAMMLLDKKKIPFKLTIIGGSGPMEEIIREEITKNKLDKKITIISKVDFEKMKTYYLSSDILLLASVYEAYGIVVPEAMACGCGVIISDTSGTNFLVENGKNGYVFKTGNAEDLAAKIEMSVNKVEEFGRYSRKIMSTKYSAKSTINKYTELLNNAMIKK